MLCQLVMLSVHSYININIVECKYDYDIQNEFNETDININIVECKFIQDFIISPK